MISYKDLDACNRLFFQHFEFSLFYPCKGVSGNKNAVDLTSIDNIENDLKQLSEIIDKNFVSIPVRDSGYNARSRYLIFRLSYEAGSRRETFFANQLKSAGLAVGFPQGEIFWLKGNIYLKLVEKVREKARLRGLRMHL